MKRGFLQNYRPWDQLNSSVDKFQQTSQMKKIVCAVDESEFGHIKKHVETLKISDIKYVTLQGKNSKRYIGMRFLHKHKLSASRY